MNSQAIATHAANGVYVPRWAWGLIAAVLVGVLTGAAAWLSYVSTTQSDTRESVAELRAELRAVNDRLRRIEQQLDRLFQRLDR